MTGGTAGATLSRRAVAATGTTAGTAATVGAGRPSSGRSHGVLRTSLVNGARLLGHLIGVAPAWLRCTGSGGTAVDEERTNARNGGRSAKLRPPFR